MKDEIWAFQNSDPGFSPNDEYILFTAKRNFEEDIFVYNIKENKTTNLTNTGITETGSFMVRLMGNSFILLHSG